jgi:hypothetical protein
MKIVNLFCLDYSRQTEYTYASANVKQKIAGPRTAAFGRNNDFKELVAQKSNKKGCTSAAFSQ